MARKKKATSRATATRKAPRVVRPGRKKARGSPQSQRSKAAGRHVRAASAASNGDAPWLTVVGAAQNNLRNIDVAIPLQRFVCVTGVSGSGKSSLVNDILCQHLMRDLNRAEKVTPGRCERIDGLEHLDKIIDIDQSPIGRTPRSNPATYIKVFDLVRDLYTKVPDAKVRGYKPGRFSFNVPAGGSGGGRCEACEGNGSTRMDMDFLADVWVTCPICDGHRFNRETLQILFKHKSIAEVLEMDVQEALAHFEAVPKIAAMLQTLHDVGLDYVKLGQPSPTLSGGEAQRIKLARELVKRATGRTLYVLDEPTTGLHFEDIKKLLEVLQRLVDAGNSVLVVEHNLDVIKTADWVIDLGPEGGVGGGRIVAQGTPEKIAASKKSYTGEVLRHALGMEAWPPADARPAAAQGSGAEGVKSEKGEKGRTGVKGRPGAAGATTAGEVLGSRSGGGYGIAAASGTRRNVVRVVGARQHNLKDITVEVPREKMTVVSGVSGSGKSSFAIDTIYTEGQRRYVESLSAYARQFVGQLQKPNVEHIEGLSPAICIEQKAAGRSPRSTVGTVTEIYDYIRVLWARLGQAYCPKCQVPIGTQTSDEIVEKLLELGEGTRVVLMAPAVRLGQETFAAMFARTRAGGYTRVRIDGQVYSLDELPDVDHKTDHRIEWVIDRVIIRKSQASRLADSVEHALTLGDGVMIAQIAEEGSRSEPRASARSESRLNNDPRSENKPSEETGPTESDGGSGEGGGAGRNDTDREKAGRRSVGTSARAEARGSLDADDRHAPAGAPARGATELRFSQHHACDKCGTSYEELTPHHFGFNSRLGWCESCEGLGVQLGASPAAIVVHPTRSILGGAIAGWDQLDPGNPLYAIVTAVANHIGCDPDDPWNTLSESHRQALLHGTGGAWIDVPPAGSDVWHRFVAGESAGAEAWHGLPARDSTGGKPVSPKKRDQTAQAETGLPTGDSARAEARGSGTDDVVDGAQGCSEARNSHIPPGTRVRWRGFYPAINRATRVSWVYRKKLEDLVTDVPCETCAGGRLRPDAAAVRLRGRTIRDVCNMPLGEALAWFNALKFTGRERDMAGELVREVQSRLNFLVDVGLDYVALHRSAPTLSGGESQRIRLASQLGSGLTGVLYVLDEPTIGLHPRDNGRLIAALHKLRRLGNTLLMVEHDREVIESADHVLDFGPAAGRFGGEVTAAASPKQLRSKRESLTGKYLSGRETIAIPTNRRPVSPYVYDLRRHADNSPSEPRASARAESLPEPRASARAESAFDEDSQIENDYDDVDPMFDPDVDVDPDHRLELESDIRAARKGVSNRKSARAKARGSLSEKIVRGSEVEADDGGNRERRSQRTVARAEARGSGKTRGAGGWGNTRGDRGPVRTRGDDRSGDALKWLVIHGARENNLKEIDVAFPLGRLTCVTGVSGSGKSSLVTSILYPALALRIHRARLTPGGHDRITGMEHIDKIINVDQSPIGASPHSTPVTYTGVFDAIRELFARLPDARVRGYTAGRFSFNSRGGRCEQCEGMGRRCIEMHFLPDVWIDCEACGGTRFASDTLDVRFRGKNISDVLNMSVGEARELFESVPKVRRMLDTLEDVGLGYLPLGQPAPTLSGGEAQRVKLAAELGRPQTGKTLYVLDEPTTGLHFDDLKKLLAVIHRLVDLGNTCVCIEHNLDVIKTADWVIDLGPEAGDARGGGWWRSVRRTICRTCASRTRAVPWRRC